MSTIDANKTRVLFKTSGVFVSEKTIKDYLLNIKELSKSRDNQIQKLKAENAQLKDKNYKDNELDSMKKQVESAKIDIEIMKKDMYRGFPITEKEKAAIYNWSKKHDKKEHKNTRGYHGAIGGGFDYVFTPTSIGTVGVCVCKTCERRAYAAAFSDPKIGYNRDKYKEYMKKYNGEFIFQDI